MTTYATPNTGNYYVGKGRVYFKPEGSSEYRHLGNCASVTLEPAIEKLDHFSSMEGTRKKDKSIVVEQGGTLNIVMEEFIAENLQMALFGGSVVEQTGGDKEFEIFAVSQVVGAVKFEGANDVGPKQFVELYNVSMNAAGAIELITDEWGQIELEGEVLARNSDGKFGLWQVV